MAIEFDCACGKRLSVPDDAAGRRAKCPACGALRDVPGKLPPEVEPEEPEPEGMVDRVVADYASMKERAPELSRIALAIGIWAAAAMLLMLIVSFIVGALGWIALLFVWLPQIAFGAWLAYAILKLEPGTPARARTAALVIAGANWTMLILSATVAGVHGVAILNLVVSLATIMGFGFLYFYFGRDEVAAFFAAPTEDEEAPDAPEPTEGSGSP